MYLYSTSIKENTKELRQELSKRGIKMADNDLTMPILYCNKGVCYSIPYIRQEIVIDESYRGIPIQDKRMFLAIASITSDNDYNQYFVVDESYIAKSNTDEIFKKGDFLFVDNPSEMEDILLYCHKAHPMEIIKYFSTHKEE